MHYENLSSGGDRTVAEIPWDHNYGTIGAANDVLRALKGGLSLGSADETEKYKEEAQFTQAASYTYLSMEFDQAFVVTEEQRSGSSAHTGAPHRRARFYDENVG